MSVTMRKETGRSEATEARIAGLDLPKGGFTAAARGAALTRLRTMGLPTSRDEYWKWTDPAVLNGATPPGSAAFRVDRPIFDGRDKLRLIFTDGVFDADASDQGALDGVEPRKRARRASPRTRGRAVHDDRRQRWPRRLVRRVPPSA